MESDHELVKVTRNPTWEPKEMMEHWEHFKEKFELYESMLVPPPNDLATYRATRVPD